MTASRRFLYWGVFLVATGAVMVAADLKFVDVSTIGDALRFWPLAVIALGAAILLRRTRVNPAAWVVAAALPGLALGGVAVAAPSEVIECGGSTPAITQNVAGSFAGPATVDLTTGCGTLQVGTAAGTGWTFAGGNTANRPATVYQTPSSLSILAGDGAHAFPLDHGRDVWRLTLPTSRIDSLNLAVNAGQGTVDLAGAQVGNLQVTTNAGRASVDLTQASVANLTATLNAGELSIRLPDGQDSSGSLAANAGRFLVCVPPGVGVQVERTGVLGSMRYGDREADGNVWQSPDYASAAHHADLTVHVNLASIDINPNGGCK